jgi:hypothetical protein
MLKNLLATVPWTLVGTALVMLALMGIFVIVERRRDRADRKTVAKVEDNLANVVHFAQKQHVQQHGRPSTDLIRLEASLPRRST